MWVVLVGNRVVEPNTFFKESGYSLLGRPVGTATGGGGVAPPVVLVVRGNKTNPNFWGGVMRNGMLMRGMGVCKVKERNM